MGKATGFMEYTREKPKERNPLTRLSDWKEYSTSFSDEMLSQTRSAVHGLRHSFLPYGNGNQSCNIGMSNS